MQLLDIFKRIKTLSLITLSILVLFVVSLTMYQTLDINASALANKNKALQEKIKSSSNELVKSEEENKKVIEFFKENPQLKVLNINNEIDFFLFQEEFRKDIKTIYHKADVIFPQKSKFISTNTKLNGIEITIKFPYLNDFYLNQMIDYLNDNWFYNCTEFKYTMNVKEFEIKILLYNNEKINSIFGQR